MSMAKLALKLQAMTQRQMMTEELIAVIEAEVAKNSETHTQHERSQLATLIMNRSISNGKRQMEELTQFVASLSNRLAELEVILVEREKVWPVRGSNPRHSRY